MAKDLEQAGPEDRPHRRGGILRKLIGLVTVLAILAVLVLKFCTFYVEPGWWGIKISSATSGALPHPYGTGLHFVLPYFQRFDVFPRGVQLMEFTGSPGDATVRIQFMPQMEIKLAGENPARIDLSLLYEIKDPYQLLGKVGYLYENSKAPGPGAYKYLGTVADAAQEAVRRFLGNLSSEGFYRDPLRRRQLLQDAVAHMNAVFAKDEKGIVVHSLLLRAFRYDESIENAIEEKVLNQQRVKTTAATARLEALKEQLNKLIGEGKDAAAKIEADGDAYASTRLVEAERQQRIHEADGKLVFARASSAKVSKRRAAMEVAGADNAVSLEMSDVLDGVDAIILPVGGAGGINLLDIDQAMSMLGASQGN
ncbi:MAG: SPFH domain-containing protein [Candidatus Schekmanbacteria bacterium]|nr:SPFH domain-containing protein [Candidatus Schekmanbacteria bacterium]